MFIEVFFKKRGAGTDRRGQTLIEMTFAMIIILFMIYGLVRASRWAVLDSVDRRYRHDNLMRDNTLEGDQQLNPQGYRVRHPDMEFRTANTDI